MPKRTKKLLIYLDQNFISEIAKAGIKNRVKPEWTTLFELLREGFLDEKLVVPQSRFHNVETSLAPALKKRIVTYQNYLGQVDLQSPEHVKHLQMGRFLQRFLGNNNEDPFAVEVAFRDPPDKRVQQFNIVANLDWSPFAQRRGATAAELESIRRECIGDKVGYEDQLEKELRAVRDHFLKSAGEYAYLCRDPMRELAAFSNDPVFRAIPIVSVAARLWASILTNPTRKIQTGDATDIEVLATYLPYMDIVGTDAFMGTQLTALSIDQEHAIQIFNAKTASLKKFCDFLQDYLRNTLPVNRPTMSVFVLPSPSVKRNAFRLFRELGAAARLFGTEEYAEVYGFDDGAMPKYELPRVPGQAIPFYGLQEVSPVKVEPGTATERFLTICRERCKSDHFVVIDEYRPVKETFLVGAAMSAEAGQQSFEGYRIHGKNAQQSVALAAPA